MSGDRPSQPVRQNRVLTDAAELMLKTFRRKNASSLDAMEKIEKMAQHSRQKRAANNRKADQA